MYAGLSIELVQTLSPCKPLDTGCGLVLAEGPQYISIKKHQLCSYFCTSLGRAPDSAHKRPGAQNGLRFAVGQAVAL